MDEDVHYELYGEYVSLRELGVSTLICTAFAMLFYFAAPAVAEALDLQVTGISITLGAAGAALGFAVSMLVTKVKRVVVEV